MLALAVVAVTIFVIDASRGVVASLEHSESDAKLPNSALTPNNSIERTREGQSDKRRPRRARRSAQPIGVGC